MKENDRPQFMQSCYVKADASKIKHKLEYLEWKLFGYYINLPYISCDHISGEVETVDEDGLYNIMKNPFNDDEFVIDCGENIDLFLALAALRKDSDIDQWFVSDPDTNGDNKWFICENSTIEEYQENCRRDGYFGSWVYNCHKATVEEIIKHFNNIHNEK